MTTYLIEENELLELLEVALKLECLERDGVDNWIGYMEGRMDMFQEYSGLTKEELEEQEYDFRDLAEHFITNYEYV